MKKEYRLIALDMDGTVLNDAKQIDEATRNAIHQALRKGIEVVFCTGRSLSEMQETLQEFPDMHYLCGESGAFVYAISEKKILHQDRIGLETAKKLQVASIRKDIMPCVFSDGICYANEKQIFQMDRYQLGQYQAAYEKICERTGDVMKWMTEEDRPMEKINLYHTGTEEREETRRYLEEQGLNVELELVDSETSSLECSPKGVSKASGLKYLCEKLGIRMEETAMVGDADNDIAALKAAGLAIAMGNANERVKAVSDLEVADNNHEGCAQAICYAAGLSVTDGGEDD